MSFLKRLFGGKEALSPEQVRERAESFFNEAENMPSSNLLKFLKHKMPAEILNAMDFGAPCHDRFAEFVLRAIREAARQAGRDAGDIPSDALPSMAIMRYGRNDPLMPLATDALASGAAVVALRDMEEWDAYGGLEPIVDIEVLHLFAARPKTLLVFHLPTRCYVRRDYLQSIIDTQSQDLKARVFVENLFEDAENEKGLVYQDEVPTYSGCALNTLSEP